MPSKGTPVHPIRVDSETWAKAQAKAARLGTTASTKARELLTQWANEPEDETFADRMAAAITGSAGSKTT